MASEGSTPIIGPIAAGAPRPFWSVMIPTYEPPPAYLEEALAGVLAQDPGPHRMQIELVDDGSVGFDPERFVGRFPRGRVTWFRGGEQAGMATNWNRCIERARGEWVHILHQDDVVRPGFYDRLREGIESAPGIGAAFCHHLALDSEGNRFARRPPVPTRGILVEWVEHVFVWLIIQASCIAVRRSVYEALGGFDPGFRYVLDWDMWKRIATRYPMWYDPTPLAGYRRHAGSVTSALIRSGGNIAEIRQSIERDRAYLPPEVAGQTIERTKRRYTWLAVRNAVNLLGRDRDLGAALGQLREARKITSAATVARELAGLVARDRLGAFARRVRRLSPRVSA